MFHIGVPVCAHLRPPLLDFRSGFLNSVVRFSAFHVVTHDARCFKVCWLVIASQTLWLTMINLQESPSRPCFHRSRNIRIEIYLVQISSSRGRSGILCSLCVDFGWAIYGKL